MPFSALLSVSSLFPLVSLWFPVGFPFGLICAPGAAVPYCGKERSYVATPSLEYPKNILTDGLVLLLRSHALGLGGNQLIWHVLSKYTDYLRLDLDKLFPASEDVLGRAGDRWRQCNGGQDPTL